MATAKKKPLPRFDNRVTVRGNAAKLLEEKLAAKKKTDNRPSLNNTICAALFEYFGITE